MHTLTLIATNGTSIMLPCKWEHVRNVLPQAIETIEVSEDDILLADGESIFKSLLLNIEATEMSGTPVFGPAIIVSKKAYTQMKKSLN